MRWSSPPGQVEPVPPGAPPLASPGAESGRHRSRVANHAPGGGLPFLVAGSAGVGGARWGAFPAGRRLTLPFRNLLGGLLPLLPAYPALSFLSCPPSPKGKDRPPTPFPAGRGRFLVFLCKGLRPLHPRGLNPGGTGAGWQTTRPAGGLPGRSPADVAVPESVGGACFLCCPPTLPLVSFPAPLPRRGRIDPQPPSQREGGESRLFHARGSAPCIPAPKPEAARAEPAV